MTSKSKKGVNTEESSASGAKASDMPSSPNDPASSSINDLVSAMTEAFKQSSQQGGRHDSTTQNVTIRQPRPYSVGQNFKIWLSQYEEYSKLANIPTPKKRAFVMSLLDQPAYRAVQLLRLSDELSYEEFITRTRFDSGKTKDGYKLLLKTRQQNPNEEVGMYADNLLELAENAYPDVDLTFKEEIARDRFMESVRCSDGIREQLYFRQPDTLSTAVRLIRQLESARLASRNSGGLKQGQASGQQKPKVQFNAISDTDGESDIQELKNLMLKLNSRLDKLEKRQVQPAKRQLDLSKIKCYSCSQYSHFARNCPDKELKEQGVQPGASQYPY